MWLRSPAVPVCLAERVRIALLSQYGRTGVDIAEALLIHANTAGKWRKRFMENGPEGILDSPRSGKPRRYDHNRVRLDILKTDLSEKPPPTRVPSGAPRLSLRGRKSARTSSSGVLREYGLRIGEARTWRVSEDPMFNRKAAAIIGEYMDAPPSVIVLAVDEKTGNQVIERPNGHARNGRGGRSSGA
ncbi:MAG: helix-turn-helix domain-containing protein [Deltaproteobacteria bacterium]|nr:helix-turn-helix domain-containing protein [Deltaproteobacteria bacterium]